MKDEATVLLGIKSQGQVVRVRSPIVDKEAYGIHFHGAVGWVLDLPVRYDEIGGTCSSHVMNHAQNSSKTLCMSSF